jgi:hypothetical protein
MEEGMPIDITNAGVCSLKKRTFGRLRFKNLSKSEAQNQTESVRLLRRQVLCCCLLLSLVATTGEKVDARPQIDLGTVRQPAEHRLALVIGNSQYPTKPLLNPGSDANEIAATLTGLGFIVTPKLDLKHDDMQNAIDSFVQTVKADDTVIFYYAGHAVQVNGRNYLVPVDAVGEKVNDVPSEMIDLDELMAPLRKAKNARNIVILDACRDNPWLGPNGWLKGLAPPQGIPPESIVAYSTDPNNTASDFVKGSPYTKHSPYTHALLTYMGQPGLTLDDFFRDVSHDVRADTDNQTPWITGSLSLPFCFRERAYVTGQILGADDDAFVLISGEQVLSWNEDSTNARRIMLQSGDNPLIVKVYNQKTFTPGVDLHDVNPAFPPGPGHLPEGWNYSLTICSPDSTKCHTFSSREDRPVKDGPHHGKLFTVMTAIVHVDAASGQITLMNVDDSVWQRQK